MRRKGKNKFDNFILGIILGLIGAVIGFFVFGYYWSWSNGETINYFINTVFIGTPYYQDKIVMLSILFDVILFFALYQFKMYELCKGLLLVVLLSIPVVVYLY